MTVCEVGDVVTVEFPYSDLQLVTVDQRLVLRRVGRVSVPDRSSILQALGQLLQALEVKFASS